VYARLIVRWRLLQPRSCK